MINVHCAAADPWGTTCGGGTATMAVDHAAAVGKALCGKGREVGFRPSVFTESSYFCWTSLFVDG